MKDDNESAISLPVYFEHVKKWTIFFFFAKKQKKKEKKILQRDSNPGTSFYTVGLRVFSAIAPR